MELINATRMVSACTQGLEPSGRESLVIVIKGTFVLPARGESVRLAEAQLPLAMADTFSGEPGLSSPVHEADFAPQKAQCDVLLNGSAHAPGGRPTSRLEIALRIGPWSKRFNVVGSRRWDCSGATLRSTPPQPFLTQHISYDVAFGGTDLKHEDSAQHVAFMANPVGRGFHRHLRKEWVDGQPLPCTEEIGHVVNDPDGAYRPMSLGPIGRGWEPRSAFAGTYDDDWLQRHFPFLPPDFDNRYYQSAPADQQLPVALCAGSPQEVTLLNLTPEGACHFVLPYLAAPVHVFPRRGGHEEYQAALDTISFEPDERRFSLCWRVTRPLKRDLFEISEILVGKKPREWWMQREDAALTEEAPS